MSELRDQRLEKLTKLRESGVPVYPERYETTHTCLAAKELDDGTRVRIAGRVMARRLMGKLNFGHLQDRSGKVQVSFKKGVLSDESFQWFRKLLDIGDFVGIEGEVWTTQTGEKTVDARELTFLGKALLPLPEKWHGLVDQEARYRKRYLDLVMNDESRDLFRFRSRFIAFVRRWLDAADFLEVETPILAAAASGAAARPFQTHHNALDIDLYLRIAPETYLKRLVVGGFERVYELGKNFRNEGLDPSHLQEFTMLEYYAAYWNYRDNMRFIQRMIQGALQELLGTQRIVHGEHEIDFSGDWPEKSFAQLLREDAGIDIGEHPSREALVQAIRRAGISLEFDRYPSRAALIDGLYKTVSRPKLVQPTFLTEHPTELTPLARRNDQDPGIVDRFQLVVNGWEVVNAYSELVDPIDQLERLREQQALRAAGDDETMMLEKDYIECMEHGMPPISGLGLGIDRFVALLRNQDNLRDVVLFPMMRPLAEDQAVEASSAESPA